MRIIPTLFFIFISTLASFSQTTTWYWTKQADSASEIATYDAVDRNGNAYYTGYFNAGNSVTFGNNVRLTRTGSLDDFLVKYNLAGTPLWARSGQAQATNALIEGQAVATDRNNSVVETGYFTDSVVFGTTKLAAPSSAPFTDVSFVVKYDGNGNCLWAKSPDHVNSQVQANYVATDLKNNIYVVGNYSDTVVFGKDTLTTKTGGTFLVKYSSSGGVIWARSVRDVNNSSSSVGRCVAVDDSCNVIISGQMIDSLAFGSIIINAQPLTQTQVFIAKYDSAGNPKWALNLPADWTGTATPIATDKSGNVVISAMYSNRNLTIGTTTLTDPATPCSNALLAKYDRNGNPVWATQARYISNAEVCVIIETCVATDRCNNIYWSGFASDTFAVGRAYVTVAGANTHRSRPFTYVMKLDSNGNGISGSALANQSTASFSDGLAVDSSNRVALDASLSAPSTLVVGNDTVNEFNTDQTSFMSRFSIGPLVETAHGGDSICRGDSVILDVVPAPGTTYTWSTGQTTDSITVKPTTTQTYFVVASGCNNDTSYITIRVNQPSVVTIIPPADTICPGGAVVITANGANNYVWSPGNGLSCVQCPNPIASPATTTPYTVIGTNAYGCVDSAKTQVVVRLIPPHTVTTLPSSDSICSGDSAHIMATGGSGYVWTPGNSTASNIWAKPATQATYSLAVSFTTSQCVLDTTITINIKPLPVVTVTPPNTICKGDSITLTATGGGTYIWSNNSTNSSIKVSPADTTKYTVVVTKGCVDSASTKVMVTAPMLNACCNDTIHPGSDVTLTASGATNYTWTPITGLSCTNCADPVASPAITTTYTVTSDAGGCVSTRSLTVDVQTACADFKVPNVFTPNNDGINDDLVIDVLNPTSYNISIYDRWGKEVYTSANSSTYWNGRDMGTENLVPDGTYYYIINASCSANNYTKQGFIEVAGEK